MARLEITSPDPALCGIVARIVFTDGKAWVTALTDGQRALLERRGFTVSDPDAPPTPQPAPESTPDAAEPHAQAAPARTSGRRKPPPAQPNDE